MYISEELYYIYVDMILSCLTRLTLYSEVLQGCVHCTVYSKSSTWFISWLINIIFCQIFNQFPVLSISCLANFLSCQFPVLPISCLTNFLSCQFPVLPIAEKIWRSNIFQNNQNLNDLK